MSDSFELVGDVLKVATKRGQGARGPWTLYNILLGTNEGEKWASYGFDAPSFGEGDRIRGQVFLKDGKYLTFVKGAPVEKKAAPKADKPANATGNSSSGGYENRQDSIVYQSSRKDALHLVEILLANDALPVSSAKSKTGEAKRFDEIHEFVNKLTVQFFHDVLTLRLTETVADAGEVDTSPKGEIPENDPPAEEDDEDFDDIGF